MSLPMERMGILHGCLGAARPDGDGDATTQAEARQVPSKTSIGKLGVSAPAPPGSAVHPASGADARVTPIRHATPRPDLHLPIRGLLSAVWPTPSPPGDCPPDCA